MTPCTHRLSQETQNSEQVSQDCGPSSSSLSSPISHVEYTATTSEPPLTSESDNHSLVQRTAYHVQPITQTYRGRARGIQNYSAADRMTLLDSIEKHRPVSIELWEKVLADYNQYAARFGRTERTVHSLRDQYRTMVYNKKPAVDPQYLHVQRATRLAVESGNEHSIEPDTLDSTESCSSRSSSDRSHGSLPNSPSTHTARKQTYRGRARGIQNYSVSDRMTLLDSIEKHQPISSELWEKVHADYSQYAARLGRTERTVHSLQEAFRAMCYHRLKPTGNPQCPDYVQRAKQLAIEIRKSALDSTEGCSSRSSSDQSRGSLTPTPGIHTASSSTSTTSSANCTTEAALERARTWASAADGISLRLADEVALRHGSQSVLKRKASDDDLRDDSQPPLKREAADDDLPIPSATALDPARRTDSNSFGRPDSSILQELEQLRQEIQKLRGDCKMSKQLSRENQELRGHCKMLRSMLDLLLDDSHKDLLEENGYDQGRNDTLSQETVEQLRKDDQKLQDDCKISLRQAADSGFL